VRSAGAGVAAPAIGTRSSLLADLLVLQLLLSFQLVGAARLGREILRSLSRSSVSIVCLLWIGLARPSAAFCSAMMRAADRARGCDRVNSPRVRPPAGHDRER
jgi:hypothetical protein